eukprot:TRINITY_DN51602_c0_g1_i1.p1 TRINITY_DN51602_c0_g1~~TRINITY_DN51602_c0_g1_i1.p1  ORF type:complete len:129 (-),score=9.45 TRINITY_DN51602_c0_g1_i1:235-621(-)
MCRLEWYVAGDFARRDSSSELELLSEAKCHIFAAGDSQGSNAIDNHRRSLQDTQDLRKWGTLLPQAVRSIPDLFEVRRVTRARAQGMTQCEGAADGTDGEIDAINRCEDGSNSSRLMFRSARARFFTT